MSMNNSPVAYVWMELIAQFWWERLKTISHNYDYNKQWILLKLSFHWYFHFIQKEKWNIYGGFRIKFKVFQKMDSLKKSNHWWQNDDNKDAFKEG